MKTKLFFLSLVLTGISVSTLFAQTKAPAPKKPVTAAAVPSIPGKTKVKITTDMGVIIVRLYDATPKHRDNFIKLVKEGFYDSLMFHRIIQGFMIQGGDPLSKHAQPGEMLGMGGGDMERIPAEFNPKLIHKKGALCAARDGNPEKASSACQFYIVQGKPSANEELDMIGQQNGIKYTPEQKKIYNTIGGTPFLDMNYTVYGEVVSGLDVVDKIAAADKEPGDRPKKDIRMKMELMKK
jgi:peptidyl-prolyl cis-trans isomerase B (cyclophilin B)